LSKELFIGRGMKISRILNLKTDAPSHAYFREIEQGVLWELGLCSLNG